MNEHLDKALRALRDSDSYPRLLVNSAQMHEVFFMGEPLKGFSTRVREWADRNGYALYADFVGRLTGNGVFVYCRTEDIAAEFKLTFL